MKKRNITGYGAAFFIPLVMWVVLLWVMKVYPFGNNSFVIGDFYFQYTSYFQYFVEAVREGNSLIYGWDAGVGNAFYGIYTYYLASPFTWVLLLFPKDQFHLSLVVMVLLKIAAAGITSTYYLRRQFRTWGWFEILFFSTSYSLMNYSVQHFINPMWLDGMILLPLLMIALQRLIERKKATPFTLLLTLMFVSNYYIAYMVGIFLAFYVLLSRTSRTDIIRFIKAAAIAILLSAWVWLPTAWLLMDGQSNWKEWVFHMDIWTFLQSWLAGRQGHEGLSEGSFYVGVMIWVLLPLFVFSSSIKAKTKLLWGGLAIILSLSVFIPFLHKAWHGFAMPNGLPYRFSFLLSFVCWVMAALAYDSIDKISKRVMMIGIAAGIVAMSLVSWKSPMFHWTEWVVNLFLLLLVVGIIYFKRANRRVLLVVFLGGALMLTSSYNTFLSFYKQSLSVGTKYYQPWSTIESYQPVVSELEKKEEQAYFRISSDSQVRNNELMDLRHEGLRHSSSLISGSTEHALGSLTLSVIKADYNEIGTTPFTRFLLGESYRMTKDPLSVREKGYKWVSTVNGVHTYQNTQALEVGFETSPAIESVVYKKNASFDNEEAVASALTGRPISLYKNVPFENVRKENLKENKGEWVQKNKEKPFRATYRVHPTKSGNVYAYFPGTLTFQYGFDVDGKTMKKQTEGLQYQQVTLAEVSDSSSIWTFERLKGEHKDPKAFYEETDTTMEDIRKSMPEQTVRVERIEEETMVLTGRGGKGKERLVVTIPYDKAWEAKMNGKSVTPREVLNGFMVFDLPPDAYTLELTYALRGWKEGWAMTLIGLVLLGIWVFRERRR